MDHGEILQATNKSVIGPLIGQEYTPLPNVPLEEMLAVQRSRPGDTVGSDPRILALLYAYEQYGSSALALLEALAAHVPGSCDCLMEADA